MAALAARRATHRQPGAGGIRRDGADAMTGWKRGIGVTVAVASLGAIVWAQDVPARARMTAAEASASFVQAVADHGLSYPRQAVEAFMALPPAGRATLVRDAFAWARAYSTSPAFKAAYEKVRQERKPDAPTYDTTVDQELAKKQAEQKKDMDDALALAAQLPAANRAEMEQIVRQNIARMKDPQVVEMMRQSIVADRQEESDEYQASLAEWQKAFPADPQVLVAERLHAILDNTADIDFTAKTRQDGAVMEFVDGTFESKPEPWKMGYRAGQAAVAAARTAAADWLKALPTH
jgi:hypothetical protein